MRNWTQLQKRSPPGSPLELLTSRSSTASPVASTRRSDRSIRPTSRPGSTSPSPRPGHAVAGRPPPRRPAASLAHTIRSSVSTMTTPSRDWISPADRVSASRVIGSRIPPSAGEWRVIRATHVADDTEFYACQPLGPGPGRFKIAPEYRRSARACSWLPITRHLASRCCQLARPVPRLTRNRRSPACAVDQNWHHATQTPGTRILCRLAGVLQSGPLVWLPTRSHDLVRGRGGQVSLAIACSWRGRRTAAPADDAPGGPKRRWAAWGLLAELAGCRLARWGSLGAVSERGARGWAGDPDT